MLAYNAAVCAARQRAASVGEVERRIAEGMQHVEQPEKNMPILEWWLQVKKEEKQKKEDSVCHGPRS